MVIFSRRDQIFSIRTGDVCIDHTNIARIVFGWIYRNIIHSDHGLKGVQIIPEASVNPLLIRSVTPMTYLELVPDIAPLRDLGHEFVGLGRVDPEAYVWSFY